MRRRMRKRITAVMLTVLAACAVFCPSALAAAPDTITSVTAATSAAFFEGSTDGTTYTDLSLSTLTADGATLYDLDYTTKIAAGTVTLTKLATVDAGIKSILQYGYPLNHAASSEIEAHYKGITDEEMEYATAAAIYAYYAKQHQDTVGDSPFKAYATNTTRIRAKAGYEDVFSFFQYLLNNGEINATWTSQITSAEGTHEKIIYLDPYGEFTGVVQFTVNKCTEPWQASTTPSTLNFSAPELNSNNETDIELTLAEADYDENADMSVTVTADDYATKAEIDIYEGGGGDGGVARVKKGDVTTVSGTVRVLAEAIYNDPFDITKTDAQDMSAVQGATLSIYNDRDNLMQTGQTDANGRYTVQNLVPGRYTFKETEAPEGYELNTNVYNFTILESGALQNGSATSLTNVRANITNDPFDIFKYNDSTMAGIQGAYIGIYDMSGTLVARNVTDAAGNMRVSGLTPGTYRYQEESAPAGFDLNPSSYTFTVAADGSVSGDNTLPNTPSGGGTSPTPVPGGITNDPFYIEKVDGNTGAMLSGALFRIYDANSNVVFSGESGNNGRLLVTGLGVGSYTIYEDIAPSGYAKNSKGTTITVLNTGAVRGPTDGVLKIENLPSAATTYPTTAPYTTPTPGHSGQAYIQVYDKETKKPLPGVTITFGNGYSGVSDNNGRVFFASLADGSYEYKLSQVPETYALDGVTYKVQKTGLNSATGDLIVYVDYVRVSYKKVDSKDQSKALSGATFTLYDASYNELAKATTGGDGIAAFIKLKPGKYSVKETAAPKGYTPSNEVWTFEITASHTNKEATVVKNSGSVQTGANPVYTWTLWIGLMLMCAVVFAFICVRKSKKRKTFIENEETVGQNGIEKDTGL